MWIKEIILDGFKSYATRTVISGFDSQFNAITGLNGSGKSNILDAILFCLGLSKEYDTLRIRKLQELIYKNGTAGVTKAEVTLVIDNSDSDSGPSGYQDQRELIVTRQITTDNKSKYFINGHSESQKNFKNMFRSVQLNIDNPHFLVAQGRITKIINLKPQELIGMLEETAGTSLYNEKKREAQRTMEKKEEKLKQVNDVIETEIRPNMERLVREKNMFLVWRTQEAEKERLLESVVSYEYYRKNQMLNSRIDEQVNLQETLQETKETLQYQNEQNDRIMRELREAGSTTEIAKEFEIADKHVKKLQSQCARLERDLESSKKGKERSETEKQQLETTIRSLQSDIDRFQSRSEFVQKTIEQSKQELQERKDLLAEQQRQIKSSESNEDALAVLQEEKRNIERYIKQYKSTIDTIKDRLKAVNEEIDTSKRLAETSHRDQHNIQTKLGILRGEIDQIEKELENGLKLDSEIGNLKTKRADIERNIHDLQQKLQSYPFQLFIDMSRLKNWDYSRVYGRVFELFELMEEQYSRAIEFGIGPKVTNVIVDDEETVTEMLNQKVINMHTYYIPNNRVTQFQASDELIKAAEQIAKQQNGLARPAIQMIKYPQQLSKAIGYVFGNFFVASSMEIAQLVAYHPTNVRKYRVVTQDGDIVDPSGTVTGGYQNEKNQFLPRAREMVKIRNQIRLEEKNRDDLTEILKKKEEDSRFHSQLRNQLHDKRYHYDQLVQKQQKAINASTQDLTSLEAERRELLDQQTQSESKLQEQEEKLATLVQSSKSSNKTARQVLKEQIDRTQKDIEKLKNQLTKHKQDFQGIEVDIENCKLDVTKAQRRVIDETEYIKNHQVSIQDLQEQLGGAQSELSMIQEKRDRLERENNTATLTSSRLNDQFNECKRYIEQLVSEQKRADNELQKAKKDAHELKQELHNLENKHPFVKKNKQDLISKELPEYLAYLTGFEYEATKERLQRLEHDQSKLSKQVNFKVEAMTEQVEKEFQSLEEKRKILLNDKSMLTQNMVELDDKKAQTLEKCYFEVNKHFGQIFSSLLGGAQARISKMESKPLEEGLEISVAFNNKWKSSLSELSGGQRSLLALSFILALLKYKPAPFYILDEVDSALDLSHTENIGQILAQNFKQSQFILISLKDGMYQNANVLFKVQFLDGVSKIDRFAIKDKKKEIQKQILQQQKQSKQQLV